MRPSIRSSVVLRRVDKTSALGVMLWLILAVPVVQAQPSWRVVKKYVQPDVEIVHETREALVLRHPDWPDTTLVLTTEQREDSDIYEVLARRRGGNPYRTWKATEAFWNDPKRPKQTWGRYFRADFLRLIRPPHSGKPRKANP